MSDTSIQAAPGPAPRPTGVALDSDKDEKYTFSTDGIKFVSSEIIDSTKAVHSRDGDSTDGTHNHIIHTLTDSNGNEDTSTSNTVDMDSDKQLESTTHAENDTITDTNNTHLDSEADTVYAPTQTQHNDEISESVEADSHQLGDEDTNIDQIENTSQNTLDTLSETREAFGGDTSTDQPVSATHNTQDVSPSEPHEAIAHGTTEPSGLKTYMEALEASGSISALTSSHPDTIVDSGTTRADSISVYSGEGEDTELVADNAKSSKLVLSSSASQMDSSAATAAGNPMLRTAKSLYTMTVRSIDTTVGKLL
ncbi:hypothetical protein SARC_01751 [Sphaeroforma arctica JP610]|uniref:Uncharacterized protein n=1 Tax=Sphaeroforma arctica JP610 TaxID=667725 RepID=A0A0L0GAR3_9EUKA|nr:hypothetical protein SARC_01751 [Sphaeroforma arctica JP610]KNC86092.1 hypothetical protein SARC_01751 [Sphaeroforma arctica JP610]|eukprot:XP_014159994.1 hypothetical protein SARC_01751 [Sphaeroforma arctica JP610]